MTKLAKLIEYSLLFFILLLAFLLRLYKINSPLLDWHSFRQADTASVTREYVKNGIDILRPRYHDLSNIQSGLDNPDGYRMVEFPIINAFLATLIRNIPNLDLVVLSRLFSVIASLFTIIAIYFLGKTISGKTVGIIAAFVFATLPFAVFYSRTTLPESVLLALSTGSLALFCNYINTKKSWSYVLSLILLSLAFLIKPFVAFLAPVYLSLLLINLHYLNKKNFLAISLFVFSALPLFLWRRWILNYPTGIPASDWLLNGNGIRLRPAWFRWLFFERLTKLLLGYIGIIFLPISLIKTAKQELFFYGSWWLGILAYFIVIATGNIQHDYYQNLMLSILALTLARGIVILFNLFKKIFLPVISWAVVFVIYFLVVLSSWQQVKGFYNINHWEYLKAGQVADQLLPANAKVIAPAMGDTQFLFQTNRTGWPIGYDIENKIKLGATHYVTTTKDNEALQLKQKYSIVKETQDYLIIDLTKDKTR